MYVQLDLIDRWSWWRWWVCRISALSGLVWCLVCWGGSCWVYQASSPGGWSESIDISGGWLSSLGSWEWSSGVGSGACNSPANPPPLLYSSTFLAAAHLVPGSKIDLDRKLTSSELCRTYMCVLFTTVIRTLPDRSNSSSFVAAKKKPIQFNNNRIINNFHINWSSHWAYFVTILRLVLQLHPKMQQNKYGMLLCRFTVIIITNFSECSYMCTFNYLILLNISVSIQ